MQSWIKQTDFRPKITNPKYRNSQSPREKTTSNHIQSRIDVFSKPKHDPSVSYDKLLKVSRRNNAC